MGGFPFQSKCAVGQQNYENMLLVLLYKNLVNNQ